MKRQHIVAGNWKMNMDYQGGRELAREVMSKLQPSEVLTILCTPFIHLNSISSLIKDVSNLKLGAQNCHQEGSGAYTGEVSAPMLRSCGVEYVIIGHSERREYFGEDGPQLAAKIDAVMAHNMIPIFCLGEKLEVREADQHQALVAKQLEEGLFHLEAAAFQQVVIAYEPVWAIGTGKTASPAQAQEMHAYLRKLVEKKYGAEIAGTTSILYGGSVKPDNAAELFGQPDVDGGLIGGASLKADDFVAIVESF